MAKYAYPAIFAEENGKYLVSFPDLGGCNTFGESLPDAVEMAQDALCLMLYTLEEDNRPIPAASDWKTVQARSDDLVSIVCCDTLEYRKLFDSKAVKKTLTIPNWLNTLSERAGLNFSAILQEALKAKLDI